MLLSWYVTAGLIGCHRFLFRLTFNRHLADSDNLALRHWVLLLLSQVLLFPSLNWLVGGWLLFDRSRRRPLLLLPLRLAHEWFQSDLLIDVSFQSSFLNEGIFFQTGHPLYRSLVSNNEALRTGLRGAITILEAPCQLDIGHDGASRRLLFLLQDLQVLPQGCLTWCLIVTTCRFMIVFISLLEILGADASLTNSYCTLVLVWCQCLTPSSVTRSVELLTTHEAFRSV